MTCVNTPDNEVPPTEEEIEDLLDDFEDDETGASESTGAVGSEPPFADTDYFSHPEGDLIQYSVSENVFKPTTKTIEKLPPGMYTIEVDQNMFPFFVKKNLNTDALYRFPDTSCDAILSEVSDFWKLKKIFEDFDYLHKLGILVYGPPGGGKSACVALVIKEIIRRRGVVFLADNPGVLIGGLEEFRAVEPSRPCLIILEEIDSIISRYGDATLLSLLDGERSPVNVIFIATTNYPEDLEERIKNRPGRFDLRIEMGLPSYDDRLFYLKKKLEKREKEAVLIKYADQTDGWSIAHVKELIKQIYCFKKTFKVAHARIEGMQENISSEKTGRRKEIGFSSAPTHVVRSRKSK